VDVGPVIGGDAEAEEGVGKPSKPSSATTRPSAAPASCSSPGFADNLGQGIDLANAVRDIAFAEFPEIFSENTGVQPFWEPAEGDDIGRVQLEIFFYNGCPA
jgi:hypothetical protein